MSVFLLIPVFQVSFHGLLEMTSGCTEQKMKEYSGAQFVQCGLVCITVCNTEENCHVFIIGLHKVSEHVGGNK